MRRQQRAGWSLVSRLTMILSGLSALLVLSSGSTIWLIERGHPASTMRSWGDALWWSLTTMTTVGYGDHVPVTTIGRLIGAAVMVAGVAVIGAVAAIVALVVGLPIAIEEEHTLETEAKSLEQRLEGRLAQIEERLAQLDDHLQARLTTPKDDPEPDLREER